MKFTIRTQAARVIEAFGGAPALAEALDLTPATVYRWAYPRERGGCDGLVPSYLWPDLLRIAEERGILLSCDHFTPIHNRAAPGKRREKSVATKLLK